MSATARTFPRQVLTLALDPGRGWADVELTAGRSGLVWQVAGGAACVALLSARTARVVDSLGTPGAGATVVVTLGLAGQLAAYVVYGLLAVVLVRVGAAWNGVPVRRDAAAVVSYATYPLALAWMTRTAIAWLRPLPAGESTDPLTLLATAWGGVAMRADLASLAGADSVWLRAALTSLGAFWLWHGATLWAGMRQRLECPRAVVIAVLVVLFAVVTLGELAAQGVGLHLKEFVQWQD